MLGLSFNSTSILVGSWLLCIQNSMSVNFSVHAWSRCGGLNEELSIFVHFKHLLVGQMSSVLNGPI